MGKKVCFAFGPGCRRSQIDCAHLQTYFEVNGWNLTNSMKTADLVMLHMCAFSERPEQKSLKFLRISQKNLKSNGKIIVLGCFPGTNGELLEKYFSGPALSPKNISKIDNLIDAEVPLEEVPVPNFIEEPIRNAKHSFTSRERFMAQFSLNYLRDLTTRGLVRLGMKENGFKSNYGEAFHIRVAKGCLNECTYCAIKNACGELQSKDIDAVISEFALGLKKGANAFNLLAGDVGAYGQDIGTNVVELLNRIFEFKEDFTIILSEFNFLWLIKYGDELVNILSDNKSRIGYIILPIQSGSDRILKLMKRGHSAESALEAVHKLQRKAPEIKLSTHVLIGFPGESDEDFLATLYFLRTAQFDEIYVYPYSDRPQTEALNFPDKVPEKLIKERMKMVTREFGSVCQRQI